MVTKAFAVIGANYGDEGKGLVTNYLCHKAKNKNNRVLNILTNGGCQRGHTIIDSHNNRIICSHLGSGFEYADVMFSKFYLVNPMVFRKEYDEWCKLHNNVNKIFIDELCTISTPYDMYINRIVENRRNKKHSSCGYGIWETIHRNEHFSIIWLELRNLTDRALRSHLKYVRDIYYSMILHEYNITLTKEEKNIFYSDILLDNFINDIRFMQDKVVITDNSIYNIYDTLIFENAQGLLLDKDLHDWCTPTKTGMTYIDELLYDTNIEVTLYYVTRSYLTKHGNGDFPGECDQNEINSNIIDLTNKPNQYQGSLRFGLFNEVRAEELYNRIKLDATNHKFKIVVTHMNEYNSEYLNKYADFYSYNEQDIVSNK